MSARDRAIEAFESVRHCAIGAAPDGDGMAYYFYERTERGRGYGAQTHPPIKGAEVDPGKQGQPTYPGLVVDTIIAAYRDEMHDAIRRGYRLGWNEGHDPVAVMPMNRAELNRRLTSVFERLDAAATAARSSSS